jgi:DNA polymerase I-like protein with 3'-5' exonuclease and polymerase domains
MRGLIQPAEGSSLIYCDYRQQEYYIAAMLADDPEMMKLYTQGDPYVAFGVLIGLMPPTATEKSHPSERAIAKTVSLAALYGQGVDGMARKLRISVNRAADLLKAHKRRFPEVWRWSADLVRTSYARKRISSRLGWTMEVHSETGKNTLRNFQVQSTGADILRHAHLLLFEAGVGVCCPVHDAFLIEVPGVDPQEVALESQRIMGKAGEYVLGEDSLLRADARILRYPERLLEPKGEAMWNRMLQSVVRLSGMPIAPISGDLTQQLGR